MARVVLFSGGVNSITALYQVSVKYGENDTIYVVTLNNSNNKKAIKTKQDIIDYLSNKFYKTKYKYIQTTYTVSENGKLNEVLCVIPLAISQIIFNVGFMEHIDLYLSIPFDHYIYNASKIDDLQELIKNTISLYGTYNEVELYTNFGYNTFNVMVELMRLDKDLFNLVYPGDSKLDIDYFKTNIEIAHKISFTMDPPLNNEFAEYAKDKLDMNLFDYDPNGQNDSSNKPKKILPIFKKH